MKLFNSLTRQIEEFKPLDPQGKRVSVYTCGPTVYDEVTIGNWRTYVLSDTLIRTLAFLGYDVDFVMNITDVGHLTGDNSGDSSVGEDRLEKGARKFNKTAWDIAQHFSISFLSGFSHLHLTNPKKFTRATDYISEQIALVQRIEEKGFSYQIESDGIYFDVAAYEKAGYSYGSLSNIDQVKEGARVEINPNKKDKRDFALWKLSLPGENRHMEWDSPWGVGFPGWHIECSAMIMAELGDQIDIHLGGEDLRSTHHPNEIAQTESVTGKVPFVSYWVHGAFLQVNGGRMGKSLGNAYTLWDLCYDYENEKCPCCEPVDLKYFYMTGHYRKPLNFTFEALESATRARSKLVKKIARMRDVAQGTLLDVDLQDKHYIKFCNAINDDLNMPQALAVVWETVGDENLSDGQKLALIAQFDRVLCLDLAADGIVEKIPQDIMMLSVKRDKLRTLKIWDEADILRKEIEEQGYTIKDTAFIGLITKKRR